MKKSNLCAFFLLLATAFISCEKEKKSDTTAERKDTVKVLTAKGSFIPDKKWNDLARFIAGEKVDTSSMYFPYTQKLAWKQYAKNADLLWKDTREKLPVMRDWALKNLALSEKKGGTLLYPFSGPDFLHADTFFPTVDTIVMVGLEPIGSVPDFEKIDKNSLGSYFNGINHSLYAILKLSFFRTKAMAKDLNGKLVQDIDGTLPLLLLFMTRTKHTILHYEKVAINEKGELIKSDEANASNIGSKIIFHSDENPEKQKVLFYFAANLQNTPYTSRGGLSADGLTQNVPFRTFLKNLNINSTYIKSASYLMHRSTFSMIRELILDQSEFILQDDSGIPLLSFDREKWDIRLYGQYERPITLFKERYQADLKKAYQNENPEALPFGIGYQFKSNRSNLMLAVKK